MSVDLRSHLAAGVAALAVSAVALAPAAIPPRDTGPDAVTRGVHLAASVQPIVLEPLTAQDVETARNVIERLDPEAARQLPLAAPVPTPQNPASDFIVNAYQFIQYWVDYGVSLADYVLGFIPYGYLIGDQVSIVYYSLIRPIADSVTYSLIVPVVNDPLNIWSYVNGAIAVGQTTVTSLINLGIAEFNYFFGWLIPPLPPLPLATTETTEVAAMSLTAAAEAPAESLEPVDAPAEDPADPGVSPAVETEPETKTEPDTTTETDVDTTSETDIDADTELEVEPAVEDAPTTTTSGTVQAQGEVRGSVTAPAEPTSPMDTDTTGDKTTDVDDEPAEQPAAPDAATPDANDANDANDAEG